MHVVGLKLLPSSSHLNAHLKVSFHFENLPVYCSCLKKDAVFFTVEENVENGVVLDCLAIFQQGSRPGVQGSAMCHVLSATFDTTIL